VRAENVTRGRWFEKKFWHVREKMFGGWRRMKWVNTDFSVTQGKKEGESVKMAAAGRGESGEGHKMRIRL